MTTSLLVTQPGTPSEPCAVGTNLISMREAMEEELGKELVASALATLPGEQRQIYERMLPSSWVPTAVSWAACDAVADAAGREREEFFVLICKAGIRRVMKTVWRVFLHFTSDDALMKRAAIIFAKSRNVGVLTAQQLAPGHSELVVTSWPLMVPRHITSISAATEEILALAGRTQVTVVATATPDGARFDIRVAS